MKSDLIAIADALDQVSKLKESMIRLRTEKDGLQGQLEEVQAMPEDELIRLEEQMGKDTEALKNILREIKQGMESLNKPRVEVAL